MSALTQAFTATEPGSRTRQHVKALLGTDVASRVAAIEALARKKFKPAGPVIFELLDDPSVAVFSAALHAISDSMPELHTAMKIRLNTETRPVHAKIAAEFLSGLPGLPPPESPGASRMILATPALLMECASAELVSAHLRNPDETVRSMAVERLYELLQVDQDGVMRSTFSNLSGAYPKTVRSILRHIHTHGNARSLNWIESVVMICGSSSPDDDLKRAIAEFVVCDMGLTDRELFKRFLTASTNALAHAIAKHRYEGVFQAGCSHLTAPGDSTCQGPEALAMLVEIDEGISPDVFAQRQDRLWALLVSCAEKGEHELRAEALATLHRTGSPHALQLARKFLASASPHPVTAEAIKILGEAGNRSDAKTVETRSRHQDPKVCLAALKSLVQLRPEQAAETALTFLGNFDDDVSHTAELMLVHDFSRSVRFHHLMNRLSHALGNPGHVFAVIQALFPEKLNEALLQGTESAHPCIRQEVVCQLDGRAGQGALSICRRLVHDPSLGIRLEVARLLPAFGADAHSLACDLIENEEDTEVVAMLHSFFGKHGTCSDVPLLLPSLSNPRSRVRISALETIVALDPSRRTNTCLKLVNDENPHVVECALEHLPAASFDDPEVFDALLHKLGQAQGEGEGAVVLLDSLFSRCQDRLSSIIAAAMRGGSEEVSRRLLEMAVEHNIPEAPAILRNMRSDPTPSVQAAALEKVYNILPPEEADGWALDAIEHNDWSVRTSALNALAQSDRPDLVDRVLPLARDEDDDVRATAINLLSEFDDIRVYGELVSSLNDVHPKVKHMAETIFERGADRVPVLARLERKYGEGLTERIRSIVDSVNRWASRVGQELLGCPVKVQQYRQGIGQTRFRRGASAVEIEVSDAPVTCGHAHGDQIMMGIALHEIGHHIADRGQRGHSTTRGIARSEGLADIYHVLIDERLERILRSRRPHWGVYFDRLASYAFAGDSTVLPLDVYGSITGMLPHKVRQAVLGGQLPGTLIPAANANEHEHMTLTVAESFGVPGLVPVLPAFVACLRCGFSPDLCHDPRVGQAIALVPSRLRDITHAEILEVARRIGDVIGREPVHKRERQRMLSLMRQHALAMRQLAQVMSRMADGGQLPASFKTGAPGIRQTPSPASPTPADWPKLRGGKGLNLSQDAHFDTIEEQEVLEPDDASNQALVASIRPHIRVLRGFLERLSLADEDLYAQRAGHRLDVGQARRSVCRPTPNMLVNSSLAPAPDLYLGVLIDRSGSMGGEKIERAQRFATLVAESARGLRGIKGHVNAFDDDTLYVLGDFRHNAIASLGAGGGNNDAGALSIAAELALRSGCANRLLIMISDGSPTECSVEALRGLVEHLEVRHSIVCTQVAVEEMDHICFRHFVDLSSYDMEEAVSRFGRLIMQLTRDWR